MFLICGFMDAFCRRGFSNIKRICENGFRKLSVVWTLFLNLLDLSFQTFDASGRRSFQMNDFIYFVRTLLFVNQMVNVVDVYVVYIFCTCGCRAYTWETLSVYIERSYICGESVNVPGREIFKKNIWF